MLKSPSHLEVELYAIIFSITVVVLIWGVPRDTMNKQHLNIIVIIPPLELHQSPFKFKSLLELQSLTSGTLDKYHIPEATISYCAPISHK